MPTHLNQLTILLVGENLRQRENNICAFRQAGYRVLTAVGIREGFRQSRREQPDMIVCETRPQDLSGLELCKMIRADRYLRTTPFIFVGDSYDDSESIMRALDAGADDYLPAYFDEQYLIAKAAWMIERKCLNHTMRAFFEMTRSRQLRITNVVKETSCLMKEFDLELKNDNSADSEDQPYDIGINKRVDWGIGMIGAIANLLEEQAKAMDI